MLPELECEIEYVDFGITERVEDAVHLKQRTLQGIKEAEHLVGANNAISFDFVVAKRNSSDDLPVESKIDLAESADTD